MKKLIYLTYIIVYFLLPVDITAQIGIGTPSPRPSLLLDIDGNNTRGALLPRFGIPNLFLANPVNDPKTDLITVNSYNRSIPAQSTVDTRGLTYWDGDQWKMIRNADQLNIRHLSGGGQEMSGLLIHYVRTDSTVFSSAATSSDQNDVLSILNKMPELSVKINDSQEVNWASGYIKVFNRDFFQPFHYSSTRRGEPFRIIVLNNLAYVYEITYKWEGTVSHNQPVTAVIGYANGTVTRPWTPLRITITYPSDNKVSLKITWKGRLRYNGDLTAGLRLASTIGYSYRQTYEELIVRRFEEAK
ncbi:hypothetical protein [Dysgonomonas macrotermitis]|uniref:Uncharacterized protein n=1 Tax=Dysgonomonas macrotermitis TaxID=1346286 RepID=A0A1M4WI84_9BACT|nr:hypothetical protein [Dysgonomonas macrotermitis]SHE80936.1 hypothetical protein SAMN05444362_102232 [Dysgonomonas macrotermitis]